MTQNVWRSSVTPALISCSMHTVSPFPAAACVFPCLYICVWVCLWRRLLYCAGLEYSDLRWMAVVVVPVALNSTLGLATSSLLPLVGVVFFGAFFLSLYRCKPHAHAIMLPFTLLHGRPYCNPPYAVSVFHLFRSLRVIREKNIFHIRTLSLLLLDFLSLYFSTHSAHLSLSGVMVPTVV